MYCQYCGKKIEDNAVYCPMCGAKQRSGKSSAGYNGRERKQTDGLHYDRGGVREDICAKPGGSTLSAKYQRYF